MPWHVILPLADHYLYFGDEGADAWLEPSELWAFIWRALTWRHSAWAVCSTFRLEQPNSLTIFKVSCMGNCDLLSVSIKVKREGEAAALRKKITYSKTPQWGRMIGHELLISRPSPQQMTLTLCHCLPGNKQIKISDRQFLGDEHNSIPI